MNMQNKKHNKIFFSLPVDQFVASPQVVIAGLMDFVELLKKFELTAKTKFMEKRDDSCPPANLHS